MVIPFAIDIHMLKLVFDYENFWCEKSHDAQMKYVKVHDW